MTLLLWFGSGLVGTALARLIHCQFKFMDDTDFWCPHLGTSVVLVLLILAGPFAWCAVAAWSLVSLMECKFWKRPICDLWRKK